MHFKLKKPVIESLTAVAQVLYNRGVPTKDMRHYLHTSKKDIASYYDFGKERLRQAAILLTNAISHNNPAAVIVDCDCDGMTSAALLINYLYKIAPSWTENKVQWFLHEGKQHGLSDYPLKTIVPQTLILCPDSSSNDYEIHKRIKEELGGSVIVLDHHEAKEESRYAVVINNQLCDYPNKALSGVGVTWQFCRYLDELLELEIADEFLDLVAIGLIGDMMDIRSFETRYLIDEGLKSENIHNPLIYGLATKNKFSLGNKITPTGAAFYIVPLINSMMRSGTLEEKEILFQAMLNHKAYQTIPSTKRGHQQGEMETIVTQALRLATNVKSRQTKAQEQGVTCLEELIAFNQMSDNKALLFLLESGQLEAGIAGLCANKFASKYQRPCLILTKGQSENGECVYQGSARGYVKTGLLDFKSLCSGFDGVIMCEGHANAFGIAVRSERAEDFQKYLNEKLKDLPTETTYYVDYIYDNIHIEVEDIFDLARYSYLWGQELEEPLVAIKSLKVSKDMIEIKGAEKNPTLIIPLPNGVELIKFKVSPEEVSSLLDAGADYLTLDAVGKCQLNNFYGKETPQIRIEDFCITGRNKFDF